MNITNDGGAEIAMLNSVGYNLTTMGKEDSAAYVPEPGTISMFVPGLGTIGLVGRNRGTGTSTHVDKFAGNCHKSGSADVVVGVNISDECAALAIEDRGRDLETMFRTQYDGVARAVFRVIQDPGRAEELAVEVFLRWSRARIADDRNPEGWLYRTAMRIALDELRRRARRQRYEALSQLIHRSRTPEEIHSTEEEGDAVRLVLGSIGRRQAELLLLRNRGFGYEEIAAAIHVNPSSVGTLLRRAQESFRKEYVRRYGEK